MNNSFRSSLTASPLGVIPQSYPRLSELCAAASMSYIDRDGYREWTVTANPQPALDKQGRITGNSSSNFRKASMILDWLRHQHPAWSHELCFDELIDKRIPETKKLLIGRWQDLHNHLAKLGVHGYDILQAKAEKQGKKSGIEGFDFE